MLSVFDIGVVTKSAKTQCELTTGHSPAVPDRAAFSIRVPAPVMPFRRLIKLTELSKFLKETPGSRVTHCVTNFLRRERAT